MASVTATAAGMNKYAATAYQDLEEQAKKDYDAALPGLQAARKSLDDELTTLGQQASIFNAANSSKTLTSDLLGRIKETVTPLLKAHPVTMFDEASKNLKDYIFTYQQFDRAFSPAAMTVLASLPKNAQGAHTVIKGLRDKLGSICLENETRLTEVAKQKADFETKLREGRTQQTALLKQIGDAEYAMSPGRLASLGAWWSGKPADAPA